MLSTSLSPTAIATTADLGVLIETEFVDKHPYAVFDFKYRSIGERILVFPSTLELRTANTSQDDLRSEMIVPRSPSPDASAELETLGEEELRQLASERLFELKVSYLRLPYKPLLS
jgi:hypothetical protein